MATQGYVLDPAEGEHLIRNAGSILIKVDPSRGSNNMALGTQQVPIRTGIQVQLWVVAPPGLEDFFREVASAPGAPPRQLTREQLNEIAQKHGIRVK